MTRLAVLTTSVGSEDEAHAIARALVEGRLAACVQIAAVRSVYRWSGEVEEAGEWLLSGKIRVQDYAAAEAAILALHSYQVPEILATAVAEGFVPYCEWVAEVTQR